MQFVSDLSVTADGFSASYKMLPRGGSEAGPPLLIPAPKPGTGPQDKPGILPAEKPKASPEAKAIPGDRGESGKGEEGDAD